MIDFTNCNIKNVIIHQVGNISKDEELVISENEIEIKYNTKLRELLIRYCLFPFRNQQEMYSFTFADGDFSFNPLYQYSTSIFTDSATFVNNSKSIAKLLFERSTHQQIKSGDLFIIVFENIMIDTYSTNAIGIFKSENNHDFLKLNKQKKSIDIASDKGIDINKLDKGCIIFDVNKTDGYIISIVDNVNKGVEAQYWRDFFLNVRKLNNNYHQTSQLMKIAKQFVTRELDDDFKIGKTDQIDFLNRSMDYFEQNKTFDILEFGQQVFGTKSLIESFREFDQVYRQDNELELADSFEISPQAVKKQSRGFKSVLKLDKNFHIYIHGSRELIEQGIDEKGRKFYKIYYEEES